MKSAFIALMLFIAAVQAQKAVNVYIDFECGSNCVADASALTVGTHGSVGDWTTEVELSPSPLAYGVITNIGSPRYVGAVSVGGINYIGTGSRCLDMAHDQFEACVMTWTSSHAEVVLGYFWSPGFGGALDFNFYDEVSMMGPTDFSVLSWEMDGNTSQIGKVHTQAGTSATAINLTPVGTNHANWYWVSQLYQADGTAKLAFFNATNFLQIGSTVTQTQGANNNESVHIGEHHAVTANGSHSYYDNIVATFSAADFPLLPAAVPTVTFSGQIQINGQKIVSQ